MGISRGWAGGGLSACWALCVGASFFADETGGGVGSPGKVSGASAVGGNKEGGIVDVVVGAYRH